jgi:hypothetical protein
MLRLLTILKPRSASCCRWCCSGGVERTAGGSLDTQLRQRISFSTS